MLIVCGKCGQRSPATTIHEFAVYRCGACGARNEVLDVSLKEWLGFRYNDYLDAIIRSVKRDKFSLLRAKTPAEIVAGKLSDSQVLALKNVLKKGFSEGQSIREIRDGIKRDVGVKDLDLGDERFIPAATRELSIARTETTRLASKGAKTYYKENDVQEYKWLAANSDRTCDTCWGLNGTVYPIGSRETPPAHTYCRCTITPVTKLG